MTQLAVVCRVAKLEPHPNADRLDVLTLEWERVDWTSITPAEAASVAQLPMIRGERQVVTGQPYRVGQMGIWISSGTRIPGWLALDLWLVGVDRAKSEWFEVRRMPIRKVVSDGLFAGAEWQDNRDRPYQRWNGWRGWFKEGEDVAAYLGVVPL